MGIMSFCLEKFFEMHAKFKQTLPHLQKEQLNGQEAHDHSRFFRLHF
jgi:hypothetical protein